MRHEQSPRELRVPVRALARLQPLVGATRYRELQETASRARAELSGRTVWNVSSTATGGGVAEMLRVLIGYIRNAGVDAKWTVIDGDPAFFDITKRLHNRLHGFPGDDGELGAAETAHYRRTTQQNARGVAAALRPGDVVLLHDPQTAGLAAALRAAGAHVVWRCHIGASHHNRWTEEAWSFLRPHLAGCEAFVFSLASYVPGWVPPEQVAIIRPSIDPFSPKNQELAAGEVRSILSALGVLDGTGAQAAAATAGRPKVSRAAPIVWDGPPLRAETLLAIQVSRWDRLKDMRGVMEGFAEHGGVRATRHLALVGPEVAGVTDDPEGAEVFGECVAAWEELPVRARRQVRLITLPMTSVRQNAFMVNALQRRARVLVQKSLAEGFGLTVAEGMWKAKPVVASAVGGITEQLTPDTGILLDDPLDLDAFGKALAWLFDRPEAAAALGAHARRRVLDNFVGDKHLIAHAQLIERVVTA